MTKIYYFLILVTFNFTLLAQSVDKIEAVHNYLDGLPAVGKVLSFSSIIEVATQLNNNKPIKQQLNN